VAVGDSVSAQPSMPTEGADGAPGSGGGSDSGKKRKAVQDAAASPSPHVPLANPGKRRNSPPAEVLIPSPRHLCLAGPTLAA
jgi:hypothetical protein